MEKLLRICPMEFWVSVIILIAVKSASAVTCKYDHKKLTSMVMEGRACIGLAASIPGLATLNSTYSRYDKLVVHLVAAL